MDFRARLEFIFHSNRLDGIPLSGEDTKRILQGENTGDVTGANGKTYPAAVVWSHNEAIDFVMAQTAEFAWELREEHVLEIHRRLMNGVILSNGYYRECLLRIQGLNPFPVEQIPAFVQGICERANAGLADDDIDKGKLAWRAHHDFFYAHPFIEGNGRTARLLLNLIRLRGGLPAAIIKVNDFKAYIQGVLDYAKKRPALA